MVRVLRRFGLTMVIWISLGIILMGPAFVYREYFQRVVAQKNIICKLKLNGPKEIV